MAIMPGWKSGRRKINKSKAIPGIAAMENIRLAIDVESGDFGPKVIIAGLSEALQGWGIRFKALLCGNGSRIRDALDEAGINDPGIEIVHCSDSISPHDKRARVWRQRVDSSIIRCITLQKEGKADASVSAGDTAILMGAALFILGRSEEVSRPALAAFLPTTRKKPVLLFRCWGKFELQGRASGFFHKKWGTASSAGILTRRLLQLHCSISVRNRTKEQELFGMLIRSSEVK